MLPGSAGHVLRLLPGLQGGEVIPRSHTQLEIRNSHETFHFVMIIYFGKYFKEGLPKKKLQNFGHMSNQRR